MKIKLDLHYRNASGVELAPGEYDTTDKRLQGLAGYLVQTEHASIVSEPVDEIEDMDEEVPDADDTEGDDESESAEGDRDEADASVDDADYQAMTKGQLFNIAAAGGLELSERLNKQAIIDALIAHGKK